MSFFQGTGGRFNPLSARNLPVIGRALFAAGFVGLGILSLIYRDFALQWQPVPESLPFRPWVALANGGALILCGAALLIARYRWAAVGLAVMLFVWVVILHVPRLFGHWGDVVIWLGVAEALALLGGALLAVADAPRTVKRHRASIASTGRYCIGLALPVFGLSHFVYADFTATMVPGWIPAKLFWAYFTGAAHCAAGLAILSGVCARLGARLLTAMFGSWVLILHVPRVLADPANRVEWTMLFIAMALTGSAALLAASPVLKQRWFRRTTPEGTEWIGDFVAAAAAIGATLAMGRANAFASTTKWHERRDLFPEGVASGDPAPDSVILWTRRPFEGVASARLTVEIAEDSAFARIISAEAVTVLADSDWTCRVLAAGLRPATTYWYRFTDSKGQGSRMAGR